MTHQHKNNKCPDNMPKSTITFDKCDSCIKRAEDPSEYMSGAQNDDQVPMTYQGREQAATGAYHGDDNMSSRHHLNYPQYGTEEFERIGVRPQPVMQNLREAAISPCHGDDGDDELSSDGDSEISVWSSDIEISEETQMNFYGDEDIASLRPPSDEDNDSLLWSSASESSEEIQVIRSDGEEFAAMRLLTHSGCSAKAGGECAACELENATINVHPGQ